MIEKTLVLIKPDGLLKSLTGNILTTLSEAKLKIVASKVGTMFPVSTLTLELIFTC